MSNPIVRFTQSFAEAFASEDPCAKDKLAEARNAACIQRLYEAIGRRDYDAARLCLTPDTSFKIIGHHDFPRGHAEGIDAVLKGIQSNFETLKHTEIRLETLVAQGDVVVIIAHDSGIVLTTGESYSQPFLVEYRFRDGRVSQAREWLLPSEEP